MWASEPTASAVLPLQEDDGNSTKLVTYFDTLKALHFTPDTWPTPPKTRRSNGTVPVEASENSPLLWFCHTPLRIVAINSREKSHSGSHLLSLPRPRPAKHVAPMQAAKVAGMLLPPKARFSCRAAHPAYSVDFCGSCHATWWDVKLSGVQGVSNAKSHPIAFRANAGARLPAPNIVAFTLHTNNSRPTPFIRRKLA